jgi:hypothetical protein
MTKNADLKRRVRARMTRTGESFSAARAQVVAQAPGDRVALHVTNGDSAARLLVKARIAKAPLPWRDGLHEGPVPSLGAAELRRVRAHFLAHAAGEDEQVIEQILHSRDDTLMSHSGDYVLWFEADLYDQLQLVQILAMLADGAVAPERVLIVCVGEHPGVASFSGLTDLSTVQLDEVFAAAATPLTAAGLEFAKHAWSALTAETPEGYDAIMKSSLVELRFVPEAFLRLSREYPSIRDGLSLTERRLIAPLGGGSKTAEEVFALAAAKEQRRFLGDSFAFSTLSRLANAADPLVATESAPVGRQTRLSLTRTGIEVLAARVDHGEINDLSRWVGGVSLGRNPRWRFDEVKEEIVANDR